MQTRGSSEGTLREPERQLATTAFGVLARPSHHASALGSKYGPSPIVHPESPTRSLTIGCSETVH